MFEHRLIFNNSAPKESVNAEEGAIETKERVTGFLSDGEIVERIQRSKKNLNDKIKSVGNNLDNKDLNEFRELVSDCIEAYREKVKMLTSKGLLYNLMRQNLENEKNSKEYKNYDEEKKTDLKIDLDLVDAKIGRKEADKRYFSAIIRKLERIVELIDKKDAEEVPLRVRQFLGE